MSMLVSNQNGAIYRNGPKFWLHSCSTLRWIAVHFHQGYLTVPLLLLFVSVMPSLSRVGLFNVHIYYQPLKLLYSFFSPLQSTKLLNACVMYIATKATIFACMEGYALCNRLAALAMSTSPCI